MNNANIALLKQIDDSIGGIPLTSEEMSSFELSFADFNEKFESDLEESKEILKGLLNLLTVSEENLEKIRNQKWYERAWKTITRENKRLQQINEINLLKIQKGAIFFLQKIAESNFLLMQSMLFSLQRIEDLQIQNEQIKRYLFEIINKFNQKFKHIENKLEYHEKLINELNYLNHKQKKGIKWKMVIFGVLMILSAIATFYFSNNFLLIPHNTFFWIGIVILLFGGVMLIFKSTHFEEKQELKINSPINTEEKILLESGKLKRIKKQNDKIKVHVKTNLRELFCNFILLKEFHLFPIVPFLDKTKEIFSLLEELEQEKDKEKISLIIYDVIKISPALKDDIEEYTTHTISEFVDFLNSFFEAIIKDYLPNSVGINFQIFTDREETSKLEKKMLSIITPYFERFDEMIDVRNVLLNDFHRFNKLITENPVYSFAKDFIKGALIIPALLDDNEDFIDGYIEKFYYYRNLWLDLFDVVNNSIAPFMQNILFNFVEHKINSLDVLFDEFSNQGVELKELNNEIMEILKEQKRNLNS